jgi:lysyl-tRNA synthetase class 2
MRNDWRPSCSLTVLQQRAWLLQAIRSFFSKRQVLEVETPILGQGIGTDPNLGFFTTDFYQAPQRQTLYLQTSPEFAMKRLLAAGSGSIYQICKAFRNGEYGRFHNPEFTLLEWYRLGFSLVDLMDEIADLIAYLLPDRLSSNTGKRVSYQTVFTHFTGLDALTFDYDRYCEYARTQDLTEAIALCGRNHNLWLDMLFSHKVQPFIGQNELCMIYGFPAGQSSLAAVDTRDPRISQRVEIFIDGIELGNGYYELTDANEQKLRFEQEIEFRKISGLPVADVDNRFLSALASGLPSCAGMAMGIDRLLMVLVQADSIEAVLPFPIARA